MAILVLVFIVDFAWKNSEKKHQALYMATGLLMLAQLAPCVVAEPQSLFGGLYVGHYGGKLPARPLPLS